MDGQGGWESTAFVPLPFRVLGLIALGLLCWASNLHILHLLGLDVARVLDTRTDKATLPAPNSRPDSPVHRDTAPPVASKSYSYLINLHSPVYHIFAWFFTWTLVNYSIFVHQVRGDIQHMDKFRAIPAFAAAGVLAALFCPLNILQKRDRIIFLHAIRRCFLASANQPVFFSDVILADIFTSFAKVLGDVWISIYMLLPGGSLQMGAVDISGWSEWAIPVLMSLPYAIRLRQCIAEYQASNGQNNRALFNAIKYATSFPVIFLSTAQKIVIADIIATKGLDEAKSSPWHGEHHMFRLWFLSVCISSVYSFWWDVTNDWGLELFNFSGAPHTQAFGLRQILFFKHPIFYYLAIFINFILRFIWSMKLSPHLHTFAELDTGVLVVEACELLRRWLWVFFRTEWEAIKKGMIVEELDHTVEMRDSRIPIR